MKPVALLTLLCLVIVLVSVSLILRKLDRENYCVDISGGFKAPCGCQGDAIADMRC